MAQKSGKIASLIFHKPFGILLGLFVGLHSTVGVSAFAQAAPQDFDVSFSTYLGGNGFDACRDVCVDAEGNIIVVGGTGSANFPTTPGVHSRVLQTGGLSLGRIGVCDVFVAKFTPAGQLIWSTYLGGPNYDRAYAVEVDAQGRIFVAGGAGEGFPTTPGAFQTGFIDTHQSTKLPSTEEYGKQNGFLACVSADGQLVWASYVWYGQLCRDLALDANGDVYVTSGWNGNFAKPPDFLSGYKKSATLPGGADLNKSTGDTCVIKIKADGSAILWGSWLCGNRDEALQCMLRVTANGVYFAALTKSSNMPFNPSDSGRHSLWGISTYYDYYLARLSTDGQTLHYGTYLGGSGDENIDTHQLAIDAAGNAYLAMLTPSTDAPTTTGAFQRATGGGSDVAVCKISPNGAILACTYLGGNAGEIVEGVSLDAGGNVYITGATRSPNFPTAGTPYQPTYGAEGVFNASNNAAWNSFLTVMSPDLTSLSYSTFFGKQCIILGQNAIGGFHSNVLAPDGSLIAVGAWVTDNLPLVNAFQSSFLVSSSPPVSASDYTRHSDGIITRFTLPVMLYDEWTQFHELTGNEALPTTARTADGVPNLIKYALGLDPKQASTVVTDGVLPGLPRHEMEGNTLTLLYQKDTRKSDITYAVEASPNLADWDSNGVAESIESTSGSIQTIKATITGTAPKFARLKILR